MISAGQAFWILCVSIILGIAINSIADIHWTFTCLLLFLAVIFLILSWKYNWKSIFIIIAIVLLGIGFGMWRIDIQQLPTSNALDMQIGNVVTVEGVIIGPPDYRSNYVNLTLRCGEGCENARILVRTDAYREYNYGDQIRVNGPLQKPTNFVGDTDREFDYVSYLALSDIGYIMRFADVQVVKSGAENNKGGGDTETKQGNEALETIKSKTYSFLYFLRDKLIASISRSIPEPESSLVIGELLGEKSALSAETSHDLRATGLIHIVVLSGYNVTIIAVFLVRILRGLPRRLSLLIAMLAIIAFVIMVGAGATIVRAGAMASIMILASIIGRDYSVMRTLLLVGFGMIMFEPRILLNDVSFQLSFVATLGLLLFSPWFAAKLSFLPERFEVRNNAAAVLATQFAVMPILIHTTGLVSLIAPLANIFVLIMVSISMLLGFLTGVIGWLSASIAQLIAFPAYLSLLYQTSLIEFFANIPYSSVVVPLWSEWIVLLIWFALFIIIVRSPLFSFSGKSIDHPFSGAIPKGLLSNKK